MMKLMGRFEEALVVANRFRHKQNSMAGIESGAVFDVSGRYRYALWRAWSAYYPRIAFICM
jgi:hypothetical protein